MSTLQDNAARAARIVSEVDERLRDAGITRWQAATRTGIPYSILRRSLDFEAPLRVDDLCSLCDLLGLTVAELAAQTAAPTKGNQS